MAEIIAPILIFIVGAVFLNRHQRQLQRWERQLIWLSFAGHFVGVFALVAITRYYYGVGDMLAYHKYGSVVGAHLSSDFAQTAPRVLELFLHLGGDDLVPHGAGKSTGSMFALAGFFSFAMGNSFTGPGAVIAIIAFLAKLSIYKVLRAELSQRYWRPVLVATMLMPSVIYWCSGFVKEAIAIAFLSAVMSGGHAIIRGKKRVTGVLLVLFGIYGCALFKAYILVPFGVACAALIYMGRAARSGRSLLTSPFRIVVACLIIVLILLGIGKFFHRYDFRYVEKQVALEQKYGQQATGGSNFKLQASVVDSKVDLVVVAPWAVATALLRPAIVEARSPLSFINSLETLGLTIMLFLALRRRGWAESIRMIRSSKVLSFCTVFTLLLALGVGFATTNMGTLSRYRMPLIPFFVVVLVVLADNKKPTSQPQRRLRRSI